MSDQRCGTCQFFLPWERDAYYGNCQKGMAWIGETTRCVDGCYLHEPRVKSFAAGIWHPNSESYDDQLDAEDSDVLEVSHKEQP